MIARDFSRSGPPPIVALGEGVCNTDSSTRGLRGGGSQAALFTYAPKDGPTMRPNKNAPMTEAVWASRPRGSRPLGNKPAPASTRGWPSATSRLTDSRPTSEEVAAAVAASQPQTKAAVQCRLLAAASNAPNKTTKMKHAAPFWPSSTARATGSMFHRARGTGTCKTKLDEAPWPES